MERRLTIRAKGQMTLPAVLRRRLGLKAGDQILARDEGRRVVLEPEADGRPVAKPTAEQLRAQKELARTLRQPTEAEFRSWRRMKLAGPPLGAEEIAAAIAEGRE